MPKKSPAATKGSFKLSPQNKRILLLIGLLLAFLLLIGGLVVLVWGGEHWLFSGNPNFILKRVEVISDGYWNNRGGELARKLGLNIGKDNLFQLDMYSLRSKTAKHPSVESCRLSRRLPDTLTFRIVERIPRARLRIGGELLLDSSGVVLSKRECMACPPYLPLLLEGGVPPAPGEVMVTALPALDLIMQTVRNYSDMKIIAVNLHDPEKLVFYVQYLNRQEKRKVIMPADRKRIPMYLAALRSALLQCIGEGDTHSTLDLSFDSRVVRRRP